jgi:hypothetical protein
MLKKYISILILSLFIYNTFGFLAVHPFLSLYYKYLGMQRAEIPSKEEMIELLVFNKEDINKGRIDFRWIHSREFRYNGDMYDIVEKKETDEQLIVYCINDTKEKRLEKEFERRVHKNSTEDKNRTTGHNYNNIIISEPARSEQTNIALVYECLFGYWLTDFYNSLHLDIPSPPPRFA